MTTQLLAAGPADRVALALVRVRMIIEEYLLETAYRPDIGRARSTLISGISQITKDSVDLPRYHDIRTRIQSSSTETFHVGDPRRPGHITVDAGQSTVTIEQKPATLTSSEWRLLHCLLVNHDRIVTDCELRDAGWNGHFRHQGKANIALIVLDEQVMAPWQTDGEMSTTSNGDKIPPCGVPVSDSCSRPVSVITPALRNPFTNRRTRLSFTLARTRSIKTV